MNTVEKMEIKKELWKFVKDVNEEITLENLPEGNIDLAVYDYSRKEGQEIIPYTGFLENVADGKLKNDGDGYYFHA